MKQSLTQPQETYRATYRGSRMVLALTDVVQHQTAEQLAREIDWMRSGDIDVRLHTLGQDVRSSLERCLPRDILETPSMARDVSIMLSEIARAEHGRMEELMILSSMGGFRNGDNNVMPLLSDTRIPELVAAHPEQGALLSSVAVGLGSVPKIVFTTPDELGEEIRSVTGAGTMCFRRSATTYGPMFKREEPIFLENYARNVRDGTYRERSPEQLQHAMDTHHCIRAGKSIIGGFSLIPQDKGRLSLEVMWGCERGGDLGSLILDHATQEAGQSALYAMTVRDAVAKILRAYAGLEDKGRMSDIIHTGEVQSLAPEHAHYDTTERNPYFFWKAGKRS